MRRRFRSFGPQSPRRLGTLSVRQQNLLRPMLPAARRPHLGTAIQRGPVPVRLEGTRNEILSSLIYDGKRLRILWNRLYWFPPEQTFHEFLDYLVLHTLNREWFKRQGTLAERHIVYPRRESLSKLLATPPQADGGRIMTGPVMAYFCFGWDLYWLQLIHRLPKSLVRRLRDHDNFQGARYEVAFAAIFARAGFEIELLDETEKSVRHCEFVAPHKRTGGIVYVETKSRHRPGVLNQPGAFDIAAPLKGDLPSEAPEQRARVALEVSYTAWNVVVFADVLTIIGISIIFDA